MVGDGGKDSFEVVKEFLAGLGDRRPQKEEVQAIAVALADIYQRLMGMVGLKIKPVRSTSFRSAASFL